MTATSRRRGAPLAVLGLILGGWVVARAMLVGAELLPRGLAEPIDTIVMLERARGAATSGPTSGSLPRPAHRSAPAGRPPRGPLPEWSAAPPAAGRAGLVIGAGAPSSVLERAPLAPFAALDAAPMPFLPVGAPPTGRERRWSADAWLLARPDKGTSSGLLPAYGASQAGAVLRFRLAPGIGNRPTAYLRAAAALDGSRQKEAAAGLSARPLPDLPLVAAAELRVTSDRFGTRTRPAVMAYTELPPFDLAGALRGEGYLQGGYVGGTGATAFVDGQLRIDRKLADAGRGEVRLGGGIWGGAQDGASRLDVGPSAQVALPLPGEVFARLALDWRFRLAGDAAPKSGPALTLSAGF